MSHYPKTYENWSENLTNSSPIYYPQNDHDIIKSINKAQKNHQNIRVVGNSHSSSPMVSETDEQLLLISLAQYTLTPKNYFIDPDKMFVRVNAGWTLGKLYNKLNKGLYFLETQPASGAFTIGGVIGTPVHGGRLGGSLMADSIIEMTLIDDKGQKITKTQADSDFDLYRLSFGVLGIITSVTFKIHQMLDVQSDITTFHNVFLKENGIPKLNKHELRDFFWERISYCLTRDPDYFRTKFETEPNSLADSDTLSESSNTLNSSEDISIDKSADSEEILSKRARYTHCFLDFHNNVLLALDWKEKRNVRKLRIDTSESTLIPKISNILHRKFFPKYRTKTKYLELMNKFVRMNIHQSVVLNHLDDQDMLWVNLGTRVYFMSYFIPIYTEGEKFRWKDVSQPLEIIMKTIHRFKIQKKLFTVDFPLDFRFVTSSDKSLASPIYSENQKTVYLALDLTTGPGNLYLDDGLIKTSCWKSGSFKKQLNEDFREFYALIETRWRKLGGIAHWGKLFGFKLNDPEHTGPFHSEIVRDILPEDVKEELLEKAQPIFLNNFVKQLLNPNSDTLSSRFSSGVFRRQHYNTQETNEESD